jgi:serine phosphatase RsbU (regulator of sigma subunit)
MSRVRRNREIGGPSRLLALRRSLLLDSPSEASFDRLTAMVADLLEVPVALISLVDADRQFFKSNVGLPEPWCTRRQTPLSHSFCQHVVTADAPLVIPDARHDPVVGASAAIPDLGVVAYAGVPVRHLGETVGSLCAIDVVPREWTGEDVELLAKIALLVEDLITMRIRALAHDQDQSARLRELATTDEINTRLQRALVPRLRDADVPGFEATGVYRAGTRHMLVGGDFADVRARPGGGLDFVIGDVTGHGPEAAALGVALRAAWSAYRQAGLPDEVIMEGLNETIFREGRGLLATAITGSLSAGGGSMTLTVAGHPAPVLVSEVPVLLDLEVARGTLLGLEPDRTWPTASVALRGCGVLVYTDGIIETRNGPEPDGTRALLEAVAEHCRTPLGSLPSAVMAAAVRANEGPLTDDAAALYLRAV